jgi:glycosyltransferase involved in cell wall biosynthesis
MAGGAGGGPRVRIQHFGPRVGDCGGGGIASVIGTMLEGAERRPHDSGHTATARRTRRLYSADLWARAMVSLVGVRLRHRHLVAHVHLADGGSLHREGSVLRAAHRLGIPTVATVHASELDQILVDDFRQLARVLRRADVVHALGDREAGKLRRVIGDRPLVTIPNAVTMPPAAAPAGEVPPRVLFAGEVGTRKGVDVLMDAWAYVRAGCPDAELVMAGPLRDLPAPSGPGVEWLGAVAPAAIAPLLTGCRVAVLPSRREALPMFLIEAMAAARPVVATPVGDVDSLVDAEWLVPVEDADTLAARLLRLLTDPELASSVGAAQRERVRAGFSTEAVHPLFDELYRDLALGAAGARPARRT